MECACLRLRLRLDRKGSSLVPGQKPPSDPRSVSSVDKHIGMRIRVRRIERGVSQERLADAIGVTFQQIQKYEKGVNRVAAATLMRIAKALEAPIVEFMENNLTGEGGQAVSAFDTPGFRELSVCYLRLNEHGRKALVATARSFHNDDNLRGDAKKGTK
jgi:transcriptional regulator with XRE-family HTH domain